LNIRDPSPTLLHDGKDSIYLLWPQHFRCQPVVNANGRMSSG